MRVYSVCFMIYVSDGWCLNRVIPTTMRCSAPRDSSLTVCLFTVCDARDIKSHSHYYFADMKWISVSCIEVFINFAVIFFLTAEAESQQVADCLLRVFHSPCWLFHVERFRWNHCWQFSQMSWSSRARIGGSSSPAWITWQCPVDGWPYLIRYLMNRDTNYKWRRVSAEILNHCYCSACHLKIKKLTRVDMAVSSVQESRKIMHYLLYNVPNVFISDHCSAFISSE